MTEEPEPQEPEPQEEDEGEDIQPIIDIFKELGEYFNPKPNGTRT